ncbi:MAG: response regulator [Bdellovibrionales bacterium]
MPSKTILIVDDCPDLRELMRFMIESEGYSVELAENGHEAMEKLRRGFRPSLILLDMIMPDLDGPSFLAELVKEMPDVLDHARIIATSGKDRQPDLDNTFGFLQKPFDIDTLFSAIEKAHSAPH